jgi:hypothetical protein
MLCGEFYITQRAPHIISLCGMLHAPAGLWKWTDHIWPMGVKVIELSTLRQLYYAVNKFNPGVIMRPAEMKNSLVETLNIFYYHFSLLVIVRLIEVGLNLQKKNTFETYFFNKTMRKQQFYLQFDHSWVRFIFSSCNVIWANSKLLWALFGWWRLLFLLIKRTVQYDLYSNLWKSNFPILPVVKLMLNTKLIRSKNHFREFTMGLARLVKKSVNVSESKVCEGVSPKALRTFTQLAHKVRIRPLLILWNTNELLKSVVFLYSRTHMIIWVQSFLCIHVFTFHIPARSCVYVYQTQCKNTKL